MGELSLGKIAIKYEERHSIRAKKISITITRGQVRVTIPVGASTEQVERFLEAKKTWVFKHVQNHKIAEQITSRDYVAGEKFPYMGRELILHTQSQPGKYTTIKLEHEAVWILISEEIPPSMWSEVIRDSLLFTYQTQAKKVFKEKLDYYAEIMGLQYKVMRIKEQRTKWGSCSRQGNINLNWKIIMAPQEVIDYLIIHELAHLKHMNHSKDYWLFVKRFMPEYKKWQKWLKENGRILVL